MIDGVMDTVMSIISCTVALAVASPGNVTGFTFIISFTCQGEQYIAIQLRAEIGRARGS